MVRMRIDLVTPFADKDAAKALGARWDAAKKTWYVVNASDLTPFIRWMPNGVMPVAHGPLVSAAPGVNGPAGTAMATAVALASRGTVTQSATVVAHCGCSVLPWEMCLHNRAL